MLSILSLQQAWPFVFYILTTQMLTEIACALFETYVIIDNRFQYLLYIKSNFVTGPVKAYSETSVQLVKTGPAMAWLVRVGAMALGLLPVHSLFCRCCKGVDHIVIVTLTHHDITPTIMYRLYCQLCSYCTSFII